MQNDPLSNEVSERRPSIGFKGSELSTEEVCLVSATAFSFRSNVHCLLIVHTQKNEYGCIEC